MPPPAIRYPLPTIVALLAFGLAGWAIRGVVGRALHAVAGPVRRVVEGPDYPSSREPMRLAGPIARRVLRLRDGMPIRATPGARPSDAFGPRGFSDLYDAWPPTGPPADYRIGHDRQVGWVTAAEAPRWDTRLVVRLPGGDVPMADAPSGPARPARVEGGPSPVVGHRDGRIEVIAWAPGAAWSAVGRRGWVEAPAAADWGVLLSDAEVVAVRRSARRAAGPDAARRARLLAIYGRALDNPPLSGADEAAAIAGLPPIASGAGHVDAAESDESEGPAVDLGGVRYRARPLESLP